MRIGFVTCRPQPEITEDDKEAARALTSRGHTVEAAAWDDPGVDWTGYDRVVVRSTWNYHLELEGFEGWVGRLAAAGIPVANPGPVLRWNARKTYLEELADAGLPVIPTRRAGPSRPPDPEAWALEFGTREAVVKPVVGASAYGVERMRLGEDDGRLAERARTRELLVQPFLPEISNRGEWSVVFLGGVYSHAVLKRPANGDFRVQEELGGRSVPQEVPPGIRSLGSACLEATPAPVLYARVDAVDTPSGPVLMELELVEPALYLTSTAGAGDQFAEAILRL